MRGEGALRIVQKYYPNVTSVRDARNNTKVKVTQADCDKSDMKKPNRCAMATAFGHKHDAAIVSLAVCYLIDGNQATRYRVPSSVARELVSFDRAKIFAPGTYSLLKPSSTERLGVKRASRPARKKQGKGKPTRRIHKTAGIRSLHNPT